MNSGDSPSAGKIPATPVNGTPETARLVTAGKLPPCAGPVDDPGVPETGKPVPVSSLTPEEQMALFEKELKEKDWGHQPC